MGKRTRTCAKCKIEKSLSEFYDVKGYSYCKSCERKAARQRMKKYNATIRGKASQALQSARKAIKQNGYNVHDDLTVDELIDAFEFFDECAYCEQPFDSLTDMSIDHIVPLSKGGANTISNICVVHTSCNSKKSSKSVSEAFGEEKAAEIAEYSAFLRADEDVIEKIAYYLKREIERKKAVI